MDCDVAQEAVCCSADGLLDLLSQLAAIYNQHITLPCHYIWYLDIRDKSWKKVHFDLKTFESLKLKLNFLFTMDKVFVHDVK